MRPDCERCHAPSDKQGEAYICTFECTFCADCSDEMACICPNCGGELARRPRPARAAGQD
ncbi:MAG: DUF1272 domain-containing protein [Proteobacteria bacterium]|nr:DUF1272 domain-containing protein [Pseudomonadota bacterium]